MIDAKKFYINGEWITPTNSETIDVINPANEKVFTSIGSGCVNDINKAVDAAKEAFKIYSKTEIDERIILLKKIYNIYKKRYEEIAQTICLEMGCPIQLSRNAQTKVGLNHLKTAINLLNDYKFEFKENNYIIQQIPIGVCGLITPWNWPINQIMSKLVFVLASGCTCILKPSEISPLSAILIAEIIDEAGTPRGVFNLVNGFGSIVGDAMSRHPEISMMSFTGSTIGGISVAKSSADTVKRVSQELGGKSANIILDDSSFEKSVKQGVKKCMENSGQSCNAPTRMLVPFRRLEESFFIAKSVCNSLIVGNPQNEDTDVGPLANVKQYKKVKDLIHTGINDGAKIITGGSNRPKNIDSGFYIEPTVFAYVTEEMSIFKEEIFGPVLTITHYHDYEHALDIANNTDYGLAAYVSGIEKKDLLKLSKRLNAGQVYINYSSGGTEAPFGGLKMSGNGREKGRWGLNEFLETKAIIGE